MNRGRLVFLVQNKSTKTLGSFHLSNSNFQISFGEGIAIKNPFQSVGLREWR